MQIYEQAGRTYGLSINRYMQSGGAGRSLSDRAEASESVRQHAAANAGKATTEVGKSLGSDRELAEDRENPAVAHDFGGPSDGAELVVSK